MAGRRTFSYLMGRACLSLFGWREEQKVPEVTRAVIVAAPHTSNWDLFFTLAIGAVLGVRLRWVGKHSLFFWPLGPFLRTLGGVAVDRRTRGNAVASLVELLSGPEDLMLVISPEGTRGIARHWKSGFYWAAVGAKVPIVLGFLDYARKIGGIGHVFHPTGDIRRDFEALKAFYAPIRGKYPDQQGEVALAPEEQPKGPV